MSCRSTAVLLRAVTVTAVVVISTGPAKLWVAGVTNPSVVLHVPPLTRPAAGDFCVAPIFGTTVRRVFNRSESGGWEAQVYSQLQAFSADNQHVLRAARNGYPCCVNRNCYRRISREQGFAGRIECFCVGHGVGDPDVISIFCYDGSRTISDRIIANSNMPYAQSPESMGKPTMAK